MTFLDLIAFQATRNPHSIAIIAPSGPVSFIDFAAQLRRVAVAVSERIPGLSRRVGVSISDPYPQWLVTIALSELGHISCQIGGSPREEVELLRLDVLLSDGGARPEGCKIEILSPEWFRDALRRPPRDHLFTKPLDTDPVRLLFSSGTTGRPRKVLLSHAHLLNRMSHAAFSQTLGPLGPGCRVVSLMGPASMGGFLAPLTAWATGASVLLGPIKWALREVLTADHQNPASILASPAQLPIVLKTLPPGPMPSRNISITVGGSSLPLRLSREVRLRLTPKLILAYGSTEVGIVANGFAGRPEIEDGGTGVVFPWVQVEPVDDEDRPVPAGSIGRIRIKSPDCVEAYHEESDGEDAFRNGWFYPGDLGSLSSRGILSIAGRVSELMNIGGTKLLPEIVEAAARATGSPTDVAAFSTESPDNVEQLWLAIVADPKVDEGAIASACETKFQVHPVHVLLLDRIPRNDMGKISRMELRTLASKAKLLARQRVPDQGNTFT